MLQCSLQPNNTEVFENQRHTDDSAILRALAVVQLNMFSLRVLLEKGPNSSWRISWQSVQFAVKMSWSGCKC